MAKAGRPKKDLNLKIREILLHTTAVKRQLLPVRQFEDAVDTGSGLLTYLDDHFTDAPIYEAFRKRHFAAVHRMVFLGMIEAFERFLKELAAACIDEFSPYLHDDRYKDFRLQGDQVVAHFAVGSLGRALCEADTWLNNGVINDRFRQLLKDPQPEGKVWSDWLFPTREQAGKLKQALADSARTLAGLWQMRHTITHNSGHITVSDGLKFQSFFQAKCEMGVVLTPDDADIRYVKRFLVERADDVNGRVAQRVASILGELHRLDAKLFDNQGVADRLAKQRFGIAVTVNGAVGQP